MKFDGIFQKQRISNPQIQSGDSISNRRVGTSWFFFYKSVQIILCFWIVTVLAIITQPWLDYWVKSTIKNNTQGQVLSSFSQNLDQSVQSDFLEEEPWFYLSNGKVDIKAPIVEGTGKDSLKQGIGHHEDSVWPGEKGNIVLAGHNFDLDADNNYGKVFISLRLVEIGDEVRIEYQGRAYTYKVFKKETVKPQDTTYFGESDDWLLTFYTCDPPYTDWKRLVFQAKLDRVE